MKITASAGTHIGCVRDNNEDNFYINGFYKKNVADESCIYSDDQTRDAYTYAVCDGVGGVESGEFASLYAAEELAGFNHADLDGRFREYINAVNQRICDDIMANKGRRMGSTVALLFIAGEEASVCNVGDSRVYLLREDELTQLSHDHTRQQSMIDFGMIDREKARSSGKDHVLTQFLGVFPEEFILDPYIESKIKVRPGDIFLLCSDGLTDMASDDIIKQVIKAKASETAETIVNELIFTAIGNGGRDNVTALIVKAE